MRHLALVLILALAGCATAGPPAAAPPPGTDRAGPPPSASQQPDRAQAAAIECQRRAAEASSTPGARGGSLDSIIAGETARNHCLEMYRRAGVVP